MKSLLCIFILHCDQFNSAKCSLKIQIILAQQIMRNLNFLSIQLKPIEKDSNQMQLTKELFSHFKN